MKLFVYGDCVSRDAVNFLDTSRIELVSYCARSSLASSFLSEPINDLWSHNLSSDFQKRMVNYDLTKEIPSLIRSKEFDVLFLDFMVERHSLVKLDCDKFVTLTNELSKSGFSLDSNFEIIEPFSNEAYFLWQKGWEELVKILCQCGSLHKILINELYLSEVMDSGEDINQYSNADIAHANSYFKKVYTRVRKDLNECQIIKYDSSDFVASKNHVWGVSPFHYIKKLYLKSSSRIFDYYFRKNERPMLEHELVSFSNNAYDLSAKKDSVYLHENANEFLHQSKFYNGIHSIKYRSNRLDIRLSNFEYFDQFDQVIVCMSGAITNRGDKKAPFFSGSGIAGTLKVPMISVSDPTLSIDPNITLSWYAGNRDWPNLNIDLAELIKGFYKKGKTSIIFGGSGGGFAALAIASSLDIPAKIFIWNPQTSIADYNKKFVTNYIKTAFSYNNLYSSDYERLESSRILHDLKRVEVPSIVDIFYVQNKTDWHYEKHAKPFLNVNGVDSNTTSISNNFSFFLSDYSGGHAPLDKDVIRSVLSVLTKFDDRMLSFNQIVEIFENKSIKLLFNTNNFSESIQSFEYPEFDVEVEYHGNLAVVGILTDSGVPCDYCFYFLIDGVKEKVTSYSNKNYAYFDATSVKLDSKIEVMAYLRTESERNFKKFELDFNRPKCADDVDYDFREDVGDFDRSWISGDSNFVSLPYSGTKIYLDNIGIDWNIVFDSNSDNMWFYSLEFCGRLYQYWLDSLDESPLVI